MSYLTEPDYFITGFVLLIGLLLSLKESWQEKIRGILSKKPMLIFLAPFFFILLNQYHIQYRGLPIENGMAYASYLLLPTVVIFFADRNNPRIQIADVLVILAFWLPFDLRYIQGSWQRFSYHFLSVSASILGILLFSCYRKLDNIKFNVRISRESLLLLLKVLVLALLTLIPAGFVLDFLKWNPDPEKIKILPIAFLLILLVTALPEELLFRGFLQNLLNKTTGLSSGLIIASIVFGCAHLDNIAGGYGPPNWRYFIMASIAGLWYGTAYLQSKSILIPASLHALIDAIL